MKNINPRKPYEWVICSPKTALILLNLLVFSCIGYAQGDQSAITVPIDGSGSTENALLHLPDDYSSTSIKYPIIIFFHGTGESGSDLSKIYNSSGAGGPAYYIAHGQWPSSFTNPKDGKQYKFVVVSPQAATWSTDYKAVNFILSYLIKNYRIDVNRIYVTGLSAGGWATWNWTGHNETIPNYPAAAIVPMSMATTPTWPTAYNIAEDNVHVWGFGSLSDLWGIMTENGVDSLNKYASGSAKFTSYSGGHCCWNQFYTPSYKEKFNGVQMNIYEWMLQFSRGTTSSSDNQIPIAGIANKNLSITLPIDSVILDGSSSIDPDGTITSYSWKKISGPSQYDIENNSAITTVNKLITGSYTFLLTIMDNNGAIATDSVTVNVNASPNQPAIAAVTDSILSITLPVDSVVLDGSPSSDPTGTITAYNWNEISGPSQYNIQNNNSAITIVKNLTAGNYTFSLTVKNNSGLTSSANVKITVAAALKTIHKRIILPVPYKSNWYPNVDSQFNVQPGDTICIPAGDYANFSFANIHGTADNPVIIQNCGGVVRVGVHNTGGYTFLMDNCSYFEFSGSGEPSIEYGFEMVGTPDSEGGKDVNGLVFQNKTDNFDAHNIFINGSRGTGIVCLTWAVCSDPGTWQQNYTMQNIKFHHIKMRHTGYEGFYIGRTRDYQVDNACTTDTLYNPYIKNLEVYDNEFDSTGNDAIQVALAHYGNNKIHDNIIISPGDNGGYGQGMGILVGGNSHADVYNNYIFNGNNIGIEVLGSGLTRLYNNIIANDKSDAIQLGGHDNPTGYNITYVFNNTIVSPNGNGIIDWGTRTDTTNLFYNNLIVSPSKPTFGKPDSGIYIPPAVAIGYQVKYDVKNNLYVSDINKAGFVNPSQGDYHLTSQSPAVDAGINLSSYGIITDHDSTQRPYGKAYDVGAYEYTGGQTPNQSPIANAGKDVTINLPATATLDGSASSDPDGSIASYSWKLLSGPTGSEIQAAQMTKTSVSFQQNGTYVFQLTVADDKGATATDNITVNVIPAPVQNQSPVANAGSNITITSPADNATLNGSESKDPDGNITGYNWKKISGPSQYSIKNADSASASISNLIEGVYKFTLTVTDDQGATSTADVTVTVNAAAPNQLPIADAGENINLTLPTNSATLDGTSSKDPDGTIVSYSWKKTSGPSQFDLQNTTKPTATVNNLIAGTYTFSLTVTDNAGATSTANVTVTVDKAANQPPVANAGDNLSISLPLDSVRLSSDRSFDPDGNIVSYHWEKISGPSQFNIRNTIAEVTEANNLVVGTYLFSITVTDNTGASSTDTVSITVKPAPNQLPVANAGNDINLTSPTNAATLDGSASKDPDGNIVSYSWTKISGPSAYSLSDSDKAIAQVDNLVIGKYIFKLTVTDDKGSQASSTVTIIENPAADVPPVAIANDGKNVTITLPDNSVSLDASGSSDSDGNIVQYKWQVLSGPSYSITDSSASQTEIAQLQQGVYVLELTVTDDKGAKAVTYLKLTVNPAPNQSPVADAGKNIAITLPVNNATLNGSASHDPDGFIEDYNWKKISGPSQFLIKNATDSIATVSNLLQGSYLFSLTVTDNKGTVSKDSITVTVNAAPNQQPVANAGSNTTITLPDNTATLNGSSSSDNDGAIVSYKWIKVSGPSQYSLAQPDSIITKVNNLAEGTYIFDLIVTDNSGENDTAQITVKVNAAPVNQLPVANAGNDASITLPDNSITLSGSNSKDVDGNISSYKWIKISGPSEFYIQNSNSVSTKVDSLTAGTYIFGLIVTDNNGGKDTAQVTVKVNTAPNQLPVANAGTSNTITLPDTLQLNGSNSYDPDGSIIKYSWAEIKGESISFSNANAANTIVNNPKAGTYEFVLTVTDNKNAVAHDTVTVIVNPVPNKPPVANAGQDVIIVLPDNTTTLNGNKSYDPDGKVVSYEWKKVSGPSAFTLAGYDNEEATLSDLVAGTYTFSLEVTDGPGAKSSDNVMIIVRPKDDIPPIADAGPDTTITLPDNSIVLNAAHSYDTDDSIVSYSWNELTGPVDYNFESKDSAILSLSDLTAGNYLFELTVTDSKGISAKDQVSLTVNLSDEAQSGAVILYPNPAVNDINVFFYNKDNGKVLITIYDLLGKVVGQYSYLKDHQAIFKQDINIANLMDGMYIMQIQINNFSSSKKFIKGR